MQLNILHSANGWTLNVIDKAEITVSYKSKSQSSVPNNPVST